MLSITKIEAVTNPEGVEIEDIEITRDDGLVSVIFTINTGRRVTKKDYNLVVNPVLENGHNRIQLPSVVILGKRADITQKRHSLNSGNYNKNHYTMTNDQTLHYETSVPYEAWMSGSRLIIEGISVGCCSSKEALLGMVAENLLPTPVEAPPVEIPPVEIPPVEVPQPVQYPEFVLPISQYTEGLFDRTGAISVHFRQGKTDIDPWLFNNDWSLSQILSAVRELQSSNVHRVARIVIAGFASPEGSIAINHRLGRDRGQVLKDYIVRNTGMSPNMISTYNGEVDWAGLREFVVNSDMPSKYRVLDIIDHTSNVSRLNELQRLGEPYQYMYRNYFPLLRQAAYIKIYYNNK